MHYRIDWGDRTALRACSACRRSLNCARAAATRSLANLTFDASFAGSIGFVLLKFMFLCVCGCRRRKALSRRRRRRMPRRNRTGGSKAIRYGEITICNICDKNVFAECDRSCRMRKAATRATATKRRHPRAGPHRPFDHITCSSL
jgi:hypothetical protein